MSSAPERLLSVLPTCLRTAADAGFAPVPAVGSVSLNATRSISASASVAAITCTRRESQKHIIDGKRQRAAKKTNVAKRREQSVKVQSSGAARVQRAGGRAAPPSTSSAAPRPRRVPAAE